MRLQGLLKIPPSIITTVAPIGKPEVVLALSIVLVILVIILIISIFLLLYCVLKRQGGRTERRKREEYERARQQSKMVVTDSARKAKVSKIAASIEAAVKSAENSSKLSKKLSTASLPSILPRPKSTSQKIPAKTSNMPSEIAVEAPPLFINQIFVNRSHGTWQQVDHEPSDFSYELESDSVNDDICLQQL
uniref:Uncharacterized protein n=1 Tax=Elaeophora elaphi TaxID=1147741 RepID=A0A0R3S209_9BILA